MQYNPDDQTFSSSEEMFENCAEVRFGENVFYFQIKNDELRKKVIASFQNGKELNPYANQEAAFMVRFLRQQKPAAAKIGELNVEDKERARKLFLANLRTFDKKKAGEIKDYINKGGIKEYL